MNTVIYAYDGIELEGLLTYAPWMSKQVRIVAGEVKNLRRNCARHDATFSLPPRASMYSVING